VDLKPFSDAGHRGNKRKVRTSPHAYGKIPQRRYVCFTDEQAARHRCELVLLPFAERAKLMVDTAKLPYYHGQVTTVISGRSASMITMGAICMPTIRSSSNASSTKCARRSQRKYGEFAPSGAASNLQSIDSQLPKRRPQFKKTATLKQIYDCCDVSRVIPSGVL